MPEKKSDLLIVAMKPVKAGGAKGGDGMRRVEPRQLTFVFADSPEGGKGSRKRDESRGRPYLLHIAKAMTATSSTTTESKPERLLESMTHPANLATALRNVARNKGAPGVDGESVEEVVDNAHRLLPRLRRALLEGNVRDVEGRSRVDHRVSTFCRIEADEPQRRGEAGAREELRAFA